MRKLFISLLLLISVKLYGYYFFNGRHHPELRWLELESEHIRVIYHEPLYPTALEALGIAEAAWTAISQNLNYTPTEKTQIFISNQDQIPNGYALAGDHIIIWVEQNDFVDLFSFNPREKWLNKVIPHEMVHHFLFLAIRNWSDFFFPFSALGFPTHLSEGYAMFFSGESWGYLREDASLRQAVFARDLSSDDDSGFNYTVGFALIRYLYEQYGLEKLQELLKQRDALGLYRFQDAFKKVYHKKFSEILTDWERFIYTGYFGEAFTLKQSVTDDSSNAYTLNALYTMKHSWVEIEEMVLRDSLALIYGQKMPGQRFRELRLGHVDPEAFFHDTLRLNNERLLQRIPYAGHIRLSANGQWCCFIRYTRNRQGSILSTIYQLDCHSRNRIKIASGNYPDISDQGEIYFQKLEHEANYIRCWSKDAMLHDFLVFHPNCQINDIRISPNQTMLLITRYTEDGRFLTEQYRLADAQLILQREWHAMPLRVGWIDSLRFFVRIESKQDHRGELWVYEPSDQSMHQYLAPPFNIRPIRVQLEDSALTLLGFAELDRDQLQLGHLQMQPVPAFSESQTPQSNFSYYSGWKQLKVPYQIPIDLPGIQPSATRKYHALRDLRSFMLLGCPLEKGLVFSNLWMDPLAKHQLLITGYLPYRKTLQKAWFETIYINRNFYPELQFSFLKYDWLGGIWDNKVYTQQILNVGLAIQLPVNRITLPFLKLHYGLGLNYQNVKLQEEAPTDFIFDDGHAIIASAFLHTAYQLPYRNDWIHPVREIQLQYVVSGASQRLRMMQDFTDHIIQLQLGYAPFAGLGLTGFTLRNESSLEILNGHYLPQNQPGIDSQSNVPIAGNYITRRRYLRGFDETRLGNQLLILKNEAWLRLLENLNFSIKWGTDLLSIGYLGLGAWLDITRLTDQQQTYDYKAWGWELKGGVHILSLPTIHRFGRAFDLQGQPLQYYYQIEIPLTLPVDLN
jgi:hypothetical protein